MFPGPDQWTPLPKSILGYGTQWDTARRALLTMLAEVFGVASVCVPHPPTGPDTHWPMMVLAGLTSVADWIGSNRDYFEHEPAVTDIHAYTSLAEKRARAALTELGWLEWKPCQCPARSFTGLFPYIKEPRPLQQAVINAAESLNGPALVLLEAPMGEGKTEAALYLADRWTYTLDQQGVYVALPTMATSNQMFGRVLQFLKLRYPGQRINTQLLHSMAMLTEEFEEPLRKAEQWRQGFRPTGVQEDDASGEVVAEAWFAQNKKQAMLAPFGVGTIDQALLSVLQVRHVFVRLFGLAGKTVILDEVHAYDTYMTTLLERMLEWLHALGCSVVLLSATLPAERRKALIRAWVGDDPAEDRTKYPRLTVATGDAESRSITFDTDPERRMAVQLDWVDNNSLADRLRPVLAHGGCVAVIRNTVGEAQKTYQLLKNQLGLRHPDEIDLFHARFPFEDRQRIENRVLSRFGRRDDGVERPSRAVLVATQVIEQSLDLDFDLMVSDIAPIDLILQRAGRLHRHCRPHRPIQQPALWLLRPERFDGVPQFGRANEFVYELHILLRSYLVLRDRPRIEIPDDIDALVEAVYSGDDESISPNQEWRDALKLSLQDADRSRTAEQQKACMVVIDSPDFKDDILDSFNRQLEEDDPNSHPAIRAATRLTNPSIQLVFLPKGAGWTNIANSQKRPSLDQARKLLGRSVSLQHPAVVDHFTQQPLPPGWDNSSLLRYHRLAELGTENTCRCGERHVMRLDDELGVVIESTDHAGEIDT